MANKLQDIAGRTYNHLTVLRRAPENTKQGKPKWICKCVCGEIKIVAGYHLKNNSIQSCGCVRKDTKGAKHHLWQGVGEISGGWWNKHVTNKLEKRKLNINIDKEYAWNLYLNQNKRCALTGDEIVISYDDSINTASIDRIDSSKGYLKGNIQWVLKDINRMKWAHEQDYFIKLCKAVTEYNEL